MREGYLIGCSKQYKMAPVTRSRDQKVVKGARPDPKGARPRIVERIKNAERAGVALEGASMRRCICEPCEKLRESGAEADYFFLCECGENAVFVKVENDFCTYSNYACAACFAEDFDPDRFGDEDANYTVQCDHSYEYMEFAGACPAQAIPLRVRTKLLDPRFPAVVERFSDLSMDCAMRERGYGLAVTAVDLKKYPIELRDDTFTFTGEHP